MLMEDYDSALSHYSQYIDTLTMFASERHDLLAIALINKATVLLQLGRFAEAATSINEAIALEDNPM